METGWTTAVSGGDVVAVAGGGGDDDIRGHNSNFTNNAWDIYDISTTLTPPTLTHYDWTTTTTAISTTTATTTTVPEARVLHALLSTTTTDAGVIHHRMPDPHMMCLKLGKRHYCDGAVVSDRRATAEPSSLTATRSSSTAVRVTSSTRCQVEGCNVALGGAKEYYRRHKVCENHSKAPVVVVLGLHQRFCQQCSRFHDVTEFDEAKRSCRRRLEGHNLRRRKGNFPIDFTNVLSKENNSMMKRRHGPLSALPQSQSQSQSKPVSALSLLSSPKTEPWTSSGDLPSRCSAALYELIVANRATSVSGHFLDQNSPHQPVSNNKMHTSHDTEVLDRFNDHTTMSLDLKQAPALDFGLWSMKEKSKDPEEWTDYCWSSFGGTNFV